MKLSEALSKETYEKVKEEIEAVNKGKDKSEQVKFVDLSDGEYVSKAKYDAMSIDYESVKKQSAAQADTIEDLKKPSKDDEKLQSKIKKLEADLEDARAKSTAEHRKYVIADALRAKKCKDIDYMAYKLGDVDWNGDGSPKNLESKIKDLIDDEMTGKFFDKADPRGGYDPQGGSGGSHTNPFAKDTWNMTEQGKMLRENPEQAKSMAAEAGVKI